MHRQWEYRGDYCLANQLDRKYVVEYALSISLDFVLVTHIALTGSGMSNALGIKLSWLKNMVSKLYDKFSVWM